MLRFQKKYFIWTVVLFITEVLIAAFVNDRFFRPYVGDFLVVILMYCFLKTFLDIPTLPLAIAVLLFSYLIEILQYFNLVDRLGLGESGIVRTMLGNSFEWADLIAYTAGIITLLFIEWRRKLPVAAGN